MKEEHFVQPMSRRKILAATDFSLDSRYAAHRAAMLCASLGAEKGVLLHVIEQSLMDTLKHFVGGRAAATQEMLDGASRALAELVEEVRKRTGFVLEPQVRTGSTLDEIIDAVSGFDMLVLGARGMHPVRALALGTTSQRLLSRMRLPILVVKRKPGAAYQNALVAVDFSPNSKKALIYSRAIAPQACISVVHVFKPIIEHKLVYAGIPDEVIREYRTKAHLEAEEEMTIFIQAAGVRTDDFTRLVEYGHPPAKLPEIALKHKSDLVIVGKHGRSRIEELLLGSVTLHVLSESRCDVLVVE